MYEVEAKVHLSPSQFKVLREQLGEMAVFKGTVLKEDSYYAEGKKVYGRIRKEGSLAYFNVKNRKKGEGIEQNLEIEWQIADLPAWKRLLKECGLPISLKKTKKTELYLWKGFNIELNHVKKLGYFLEIEKVLNSKAEIPKTQKELISLFKRLGFAQKDFEKRYYLELLTA